RAEVLLAGRADEAHRHAAEAQADAEPDRHRAASARMPLAAPAGVEGVELAVQDARRVADEALEERGGRRGGELGEEEGEEAVARVLEDDAPMLLDDAGHRGEVLL